MQKISIMSDMDYLAHSMNILSDIAKITSRIDALERKFLVLKTENLQNNISSPF